MTKRPLSLLYYTPVLPTTPSDSDERLAETERAKAWIALSHFNGGSLHTNVSVELKGGSLVSKLDPILKSTN